MTDAPISRRIQRVLEIGAPLFALFERTERLVRELGADACDFLAGNPQEMAIPEYVETIHRYTDPKDAAWFAYKMSEEVAQEAAASSLRDRLGIPFQAEDIAMTNAAIAAIAVAVRVVADDGDEIVIVTPPHFLYEPLIVAAGATAVRVPVDAETLDLDVDAIAAALTPRTRAIIVNTPHNPTGTIYRSETLARLADVLTAASKRRPIYLLSDEAYNRIVFDGREFASPAAFYPNTMVLYSYGKQLLAPGERIGYIALAPDMPDRETMRIALVAGQLATGYSFPNAILQYALPELEGISVDVELIQRRRDRMVAALRDAGYELHVPEATFYLLPRSPLQDDGDFCDLLAEERILVMPGAMLEQPGYFRISLTASDDMIERSLPGFARALKRATG